jgi:hypothetical protein
VELLLVISVEQVFFVYCINRPINLERATPYHRSWIPAVGAYVLLHRTDYDNTVAMLNYVNDGDKSERRKKNPILVSQKL